MQAAQELLNFLKADLQQVESGSRCPSRGGDTESFSCGHHLRARREALQQLGQEAGWQPQRETLEIRVNYHILNDMYSLRNTCR